MKIQFTKLYQESANGDVIGAHVVLSNDQQTRSIQGKVGGPFDDGYFVATLRGTGKVSIDVVSSNTTIELKVTEN